jgi:hypothetical protein
MRYVACKDCACWEPAKIVHDDIGPAGWCRRLPPHYAETPEFEGQPALAFRVYPCTMENDGCWEGLLRKCKAKKAKAASSPK